MVGFKEQAAALADLGVSVYAASVDSGEHAREVAEETGIPIGESISQAAAEAIGAWWEGKRNIVQPSQFLMRGDGTIVQSTYSDGPLGRLLADDVLGLVGFLKKSA